MNHDINNNINNNTRLHQSFAKALGIPIEEVSEDLTYNSIPQWDSVAHMSLIAELEQTFTVMFDTDDIIDREILQKYEQSFE